MALKVVQIPEIGEITLKKNPRSKRIRLYVKPNKQVIVSLPVLASFKTAENFALKNSPWILKQLDKLNNSFTDFTLNSVYYTKNHLIKIRENKIDELRIIHDGNTISVLIPQNSNINNFQDYIQKVITEVYRIEAKKYLPPRLKELAYKFGYKYNNVSLRNNRTNWGSCSSKNNISLNLNLMKLPDHLIDYILLHELAHTIVKNHSNSFYEELNRTTNGKSKELAKEIKHYSTYTY
ncbi:MAG: M48 family metallopeptidase [Prolixibacteraceae bacterium]|nr:M48 family metallopeptidase [Prolixibacteraceae bacterium]